MDPKPSFNKPDNSLMEKPNPRPTTIEAINSAKKAGNLK
jgi:hypothetical protein